MLNVIDCFIIKLVVWFFIYKNVEVKIFIVGCGGLVFICDDFNYKLLKIGIFLIVFSDSYK